MTIDLDTYVVFMLLSLVIGSIAHEFGHALLARAAGLRPRLISIGRGQIVLRVRWGKAWIVVRLVPITGFVQSLVGPKTSRAQRFAGTAGGPLANLAIVGATAFLTLRSEPTGFAGEAVLGWMSGQLFILASSLVPSRRLSDGRTSMTDGLRLYCILRDDPLETFAALHRGVLGTILAPSAPLPAPSRHLSELMFQKTRRDRVRDAWAQDDAASSMRSILTDPSLPDAERELARRILDLCTAQQNLRDAKVKLAALRRGVG